MRKAIFDITTTLHTIRRLTFTGGEPTLFPTEVTWFSRTLKKYFNDLSVVCLNTNNTNVYARDAILNDLDIDNYLHSLPTYHDAQEIFKNTVLLTNGIELTHDNYLELLKYRTHPHSVSRTVITKNNIDNTKVLYDKARKQGVENRLSMSRATDREGHYLVTLDDQQYVYGGYNSEFCGRLAKDVMEYVRVIAYDLPSNRWCVTTNLRNNPNALHNENDFVEHIIDTDLYIWPHFKRKVLNHD